ncbi:RNA polymerase factor sigma-54 [Ulvibacter antarcticus]|uniref:RNA polymerase RpoN-/SigL-like sigma 54 subunit n=1 Tax=Ulvibacter antarcticus TaxID=442714 RepID=A0A3L9YZZ4_9FLAO|nr:RNA polymerase factor sigma-54 [Ulvibacter antarcticus]RMA66281.1 RNA polymerase RpoN-/SigL-like sigma 54 subunit [Ulvibacter antarcticus]
MLKQQLNFKLSQKLSPQQIQLMKLIQLPTQAFEQRISQEMNENPALEGGKDEGDPFDEDLSNEDYDDDFNDGTEVIETEINVDDYLSDDETPSYKLSANNYSADDEEKEMPYASGTSFNQFLMQQLSTYRLDEEEEEIAKFLVGSVDESGYIRRDLIDIVDDLAFTQNVYTSEEKIEKVLCIVQDLDPAGVGARGLQECLLLQLERKEATPAVALAISILEDSFDHFSKKHYKKLLQKFDISEDQLRSAIHEVESLNPKPGGTYSGNTRMVEHVVPDFAITIVDGKLELTLNGRNAPELHVSREYTNMLKGYKESKEKSRSQKDAVQFIKQKLDAAKWFIDAIKQRQQTLFVTMNAIMHQQEEYFLSGDERKLRPMILKDIADKISMDISTVSRVANSKYVDTPYGTRLIKDFFSESMKNDQGEDVSTKEIKKILEITIGEENKRKPLTDDKLAKILKEKGYPIARRTIAKYREQLDLPVARLRKEI